jgi:hypothetical protein
MDRNGNNIQRVVITIPEVGSSKMTTFESPIKAIPRDNFLFCPPLRVVLLEFAFSFRPTSANIFFASLLTSLGATPLKAAKT